MGEFARARSLADALRARWPDIETHFLLHRDAPYAKEFHHPVTTLPASPTLCTKEVIQVIDQFRPHVVVFDNAGRTGALRAARRVGARVVYVSSRSRQRYKAFRLRWMGLLDDHWISYPSMVAGGLGFFERLKLRLLDRPQVRFLDAVLATVDERAADELLAQFGSPDLLVVPGGGSQFHDAPITPSDFARWSKIVAAQGFRVVFIAGPAFPDRAEDMPGVRLIRGVSGGALHALLARTKVVLVNGGDTMLQALALGKACIAVPIAGDQAARIARCAALGTVNAPTAMASSGAEPAEACLELLHDQGLRSALEVTVRKAGFEDALPALVERLGVHLGLASISSR
jgi:hypothetical protein